MITFYRSNDNFRVFTITENPVSSKLIHLKQRNFLLHIVEKVIVVLYSWLQKL